MPLIPLKLKHTGPCSSLSNHVSYSLLRGSLECLRNLRLPAQPVLPKDFRRNGEFLRALQQTGSYDDLIAEDGLVVVNVGGAVGTIVAMDGVAWRRGLSVEGIDVGGKWEEERDVPESPL